MKVKVIKDFGRFNSNHKKGDELSNMHPNTAKTLEAKGFVEIITKETKKGLGVDDFNYRVRK